MPPGATLPRVVRLPGAVLLGLGSILGTGVFVSLGVATGVAGPAVIVAVTAAAIVAALNGLSSAQLAASHPVSGGTYEYGYRYLSPSLGFTAGWMFLCAKSASAATAALGFAGYLLHALGVTSAAARIGLAAGAVLTITALVAGGVQRSSRANAAIVSITILALLAFVIAGLAHLPGAGAHFSPLLPDAGIRGVLHGAALMFVAFTGYGRIATLGEEVVEPTRTIPRAIITALLLTSALYIAVAVAAIAAVGAADFSAATDGAAAPLEVAARRIGGSPLATIVAIGAITAMLGVLLNLVLGLSRVALAMARRGDLPTGLARVDGSQPRRAVIAVGVGIAGLTLISSVKTTWSFSAFTVLVYYAITNLAALRLPAEVRRYPRWVAAAGLLACASLAFWVEPRVWLAGLGVIAAGLLWHLGARRARAQGRDAAT